MISELYHWIPEKLRIGFDIVSTATALTTLFGVLTGFFALVGAAASAIYLVARTYFYIRDRRAKN